MDKFQIYFWKGFIGWILIIIIEETLGYNFLGGYIENNYKEGIHLYLYAIPGVILLGYIIHNFKRLLKK